MNEPPHAPPEAMLKTMANLTRFHREHEEFYAVAPREQAVAIQRDVRSLLALADKWSGTSPSEPTPLNPYEGAEDLTSEVALQLSGVLFMEGEGEPGEIREIKRDLLRMSQDLHSISDWLATAMEGSWDAAAALLDYAEFASLLGERHRIISNDWQAAHLSAGAGRLLRRAVEILERVDFSPKALRADLTGARVSPQLLYSAAELAARAADMLSDSASLVNESERHWRTFHERVKQVMRSPETPHGKGI